MAVTHRYYRYETRYRESSPEYCSSVIVYYRYFYVITNIYDFSKGQYGKK